MPWRGDTFSPHVRSLPFASPLGDVLVAPAMCWQRSSSPRMTPQCRPRPLFHFVPVSHNELQPAFRGIASLRCVHVVIACACICACVRECVTRLHLTPIARSCQGQLAITSALSLIMPVHAYLDCSKCFPIPMPVPLPVLTL
jgi:hypothetical protein